MYIEVDYTPEELMSLLIGDYSYARAAWKMEISRRIESPLREVSPQGGAGRHINDEPRTYTAGTIHIQIGTGYISQNPIAQMHFDGDRVKGLTVRLANPQAENFIRYLGKRLVVEDA